MATDTCLHSHALIMINWINDRGIGDPESSVTELDAGAEAESANAYPDIDGDGLVAPMDVLQLINQLNNPDVMGAFPIDAMAMEVADPVGGCDSPANGTRIALPEDWVEGDESQGDIFGIDVGEYYPSDDTRMVQPEDWVEGDESRGDIFGIAIGEYNPSSEETGEESGKRVAAVFEELGDEAGEILTDELLSRI